MKYAIFNSQGFPQAFYCLSVHGDNIPDEAIKITSQQWQELINHQGEKAYIDGEIVDYIISEDERTSNEKKTLEQQYLLELQVIDQKSIRALRTNDTDRLNALENQAVEIRAELSLLAN